jgi:hypothetical protein
MCNHESTPSSPDLPAGTPLHEFEARILAAIEEAERRGDLPSLLSSNDKRLLFMGLQDLRKGFGFIDDVHRTWPNSAEKREQAARARIAHGSDLFTGRTIRNEDELRAFVDDQKNALETIDLVGRVETGKLLVKAFRKIAEAFYQPWSKMADPRWEEFKKWIQLLRAFVILDCRAEWAGRRLAKRKDEPGCTPEFEGRPPFWFEHLPLKDAAYLKGEAERQTSRARKFELKRRAEAAREAVSLEPAAPPPAAFPPDATPLPAPVETSIAVPPVPTGTPPEPTPTEPTTTTGEKQATSPSKGRRGRRPKPETDEITTDWHAKGEPDVPTFVEQRYPQATGEERQARIDQVRGAIRREKERNRTAAKLG